MDTAGILRSIEDAYGLAHLGTAADAASGNIDLLLGLVVVELLPEARSGRRLGPTGSPTGVPLTGSWAWLGRQR